MREKRKNKREQVGFFHLHSIVFLSDLYKESRVARCFETDETNTFICYTFYFSSSCNWEMETTTREIE